MADERMEVFSERIIPDLGLQEDPQAGAGKGLAARPTMNIRAKITLGFVVLFALCALASITFWVMGSRIDQKLVFTDTVNHYAFEIQQARRYEKNFFLYRTNLPDALENIQTAREILKKEGPNIIAIIGQEKLNLMTSHLDRYEKLLNELRTVNDTPPGQAGSDPQIEGELRKHGAEMIFMALSLVDQERREVEEMSKLSRRLPLVFLTLLLAVMVYLTHFLAQQIVRPLNRFVEYTLRIARGDFSQITETRKYKDEFSRLAAAINWMMGQLQKNQEQYIQSRKMAAIGTLTSGIAHELNNPLNNICVTAESLLEEITEIPNSEKRKRLQDIYTQAERASGTVRNLLDFTRMDQPSFVPLSVDELLTSTLKLARNEMEINNIALEYSLPEGFPDIEGDFSQLQQVFLNLIINSIQAMPQGGTLRLTGEAGDSGFVSVHVADTGLGIPQAILPHIFDPFFTTKEKGTGLGLSVSYSIIQKHKGRILVKSEINQGTTFSVHIPRGKQEG